MGFPLLPFSVALGTASSQRPLPPESAPRTFARIHAQRTTGNAKLGFPRPNIGAPLRHSWTVPGSQYAKHLSGTVHLRTQQSGVDAAIASRAHSDVGASRASTGISRRTSVPTDS